MITATLRETLLKPFHTTTSRLMLIGFVAIFMGFVSSRALTSMGMALLLLASLIRYRNFSVKKFFCRSELAMLTLLFWGVFISGLWSDDKTAWLNFTRIHLPFLGLPLAFSNLPALNHSRIITLAKIYVWVMSVSAMAVFINYALNYQSINENILKGGVIPMPFSHIRYSLMVAMAFCSSVWLAAESGRRWWWLFAVGLFIFLHIVSVRSGLFALYTSSFALVIYYWGKSGKWLLAVLFIILIAVVGIFLAMNAPSLKNKMAYMLYDLREYQNNNPIDASDGMRFRSWKAAIQVAKHSPMIGVGYGDIQHAMSQWYLNNFPELKTHQHKLPHNQWLWWLVATGWLGMSVFTIAIFFPFVKFFSKIDALWLSFFVVITTSFIWEATLEEQMGTGFYIIWMLMLIQSKKAEGDE